MEDNADNHEGSIFSDFAVKLLKLLISKTRLIKIFEVYRDNSRSCDEKRIYIKF